VANDRVAFENICLLEEITMRTVYFEEVMLKTRRSEVMKEYKSVQPKHFKSIQEEGQKYSARIKWMSLWSFLINWFQLKREKAGFNPSDS